MNNENKKKKEPWRIILAIISVIFIIFMWLKKDIASTYSTMPKEDVVPLIATTVAVFLVKVVVIAAVLLLIKWVISKIIKK
ncbi:MAG: hypothetical protein IJN05_10540 [Ruminococcus sp.]|nr:hypothetical protein [Ruminococcus sp.]